MNLKLMSKYVELCKVYNKPITWGGLRLFNLSLK